MLSTRHVLSLFVAMRLFASAAALAGPSLTYDNRPSGTLAEPLVLRSFVPSLDLDPEVISRHAIGSESPGYSPKSGVLNPAKPYTPIPGLPASIAVSAGTRLSYVWDTTECRLLYAWADGFLDMENYWGEPDKGNRRSFGYVPHLIGQLFYRAQGSHPLSIDGKGIGDDLRYAGHGRASGHPTFRFDTAGRTISVAIRPGDATQTLVLDYSSSEPADELFYTDPKTAFEVLERGPGKLRILVRPNASGTYTGFKKEKLVITEATAEIGEKLYTSLGCIACHTTDGGKNHGPSFGGLAGSEREFPDHGMIKADAAYLTESISHPAAKQVPGYPEGMMPAYPLDEKQIGSLVLFIQSLD